jgi:hypothetical protein
VKIPTSRVKIISLTGAASAMEWSLSKIVRIETGKVRQLWSARS